MRLLLLQYELKKGTGNMENTTVTPTERTVNPPRSAGKDEPHACAGGLLTKAEAALPKPSARPEPPPRRASPSRGPGGRRGPPGRAGGRRRRSLPAPAAAAVDTRRLQFAVRRGRRRSAPQAAGRASTAVTAGSQGRQPPPRREASRRAARRAVSPPARRSAAAPCQQRRPSAPRRRSRGGCRDVSRAAWRPGDARGRRRQAPHAIVPRRRRRPLPGPGRRGRQAAPPLRMRRRDGAVSGGRGREDARWSPWARGSVLARGRASAGGGNGR